MASSGTFRTLPTPRIVGRTLRIVIASLLFASLAQMSLHVRDFLAPLPAWRIPGGGWWVVALVCLWALPMMIDSGFGCRWGHWVQPAFVILLIAAAAWDRMAEGSLWAAPIALLCLVLMLYVIGHAGLSFLVSGIAATPG